MLSPAGEVLPDLNAAATARLADPPVEGEAGSPPPSPEPGGARSRRGARVETAFISGTSSELLGRRPLPRALHSRPVIFLLGPPGVGKTAVARRLAGEHAAHLNSRSLLDALSHQARHRCWPAHLCEASALILDGPCFLTRRPSVIAALVQLLRARAEAGHRTMVCEAEDGSPLLSLMEGLSLDCRATVALRFPVGRGRRRYASRVCDDLGIPRRFARRVLDLEPWTYTRVTAALQRIKEEEEAALRR